MWQADRLSGRPLFPFRFPGFADLLSVENPAWARRAVGLAVKAVLLFFAVPASAKSPRPASS